MKESLQQETLQREAQPGRLALIWIDGREWEIAGDWDWAFAADAVFCSDVMLSLPQHFEGTRSLFHPDDVPMVREIVREGDGAAIRFLQFRVITSYGEIKTITGKNLLLSAAHFINEILAAQPQAAQQQQQLARQTDVLSQQLQSLNLAEKATATGTWWMNTSTNETYYSDGMFHLYRLAPQSLNIHAFTFVPFVHPDDREGVVEAFSNAFKNQLPLHIQHRIIRSDKKVRTLQQITWWRFNEQGAMVLYGSSQDITETVELENRLQETDTVRKYGERLQTFVEQSVGIAHWNVNLITRKHSYSDSFYRMHGLKPGAIMGKPSAFLSYVHPDDRDMVAEANNKIIPEHTVPDLDYRLVRPDGKVRFVRQRGKLLFQGDEMVMTVLLEDMTIEKVSERRLAELAEKESLLAFTQREAENMAGVGSWWWDIESGQITWSPNFYAILGYKPSAEVTQRHLLRAIHPDDQKLFGDNLKLALQERQESVFTFRLLKASRTLHIKASFRLLQHEGKSIFIGVVQDCSHEENLQEQLSESSRLANTLAENIPDAAIITDENNAIQLWNKHCEALFEQKREAVLERNFFDVFPQLKTEAVLANFNTVLRGTPVSLVSYRSDLIHNRYENILMLPLRNEEGVVNGILHVLHDVTHQHQMQHRLSERLNFIESLVEASVDRIIVMDRHMNYLYVNGKAATAYGITKEEIVGKNVLEIFPDSMNKPSFEHFRRALKGETVQVPAIEGFTEDHYDQVYLVPIKNEKEEVTAVLWMHHDLSHEIKLRRQLQKSDDILSNIKEAYVELDEEAVLKYANPQAEKLWNRRVEELIGHKLTDLFPVLEGSALYGAVLEAIRERKEVKGEFLSPIIDRWVFISATPFGNGIILLFNDIDEIKATQDELRRNEALLREAENVGSSGSYEAELPSMKLRFSEGMYRLFGYASKDFEPTMEFINSVTLPEDLPAVDAILKKAIETKESYVYYRRIRRADGELRYVIAQGRIICNEKGEAIKLLGTAQDITDLKQTEAELRESKRLLQQTTIASPDSITVYDLQKRQPIYLNDCLAEWSGFSNQALIDMGVEGRLALVCPEDREALLRYNEAVANSEPGKISTIEYRLQLPDGKRLWIRNRSKVFKQDEEGKATHLLSILQDVSEEVQLRRELTERIRYAEAVINSSVDRVIVLDPEYRILSWNRRCEEIYGMRKEAAIGKSLLDIFPRLKEDSVITGSLEKAFAGETIYLPVRKEIYSNRYSELFYIPITDEAGKVKMVLHLLHDITKFQETQEVLESTNSLLEEKNRELEQRHEEASLFAFIASHDLKEPLRKIHLFASWLSENDADNLSDQGKSHLLRMTSAVQRMNRLLEDLMNLAQLRQGAAKELTSLNDLLEGVKEELEEEMAKCGARIQAGSLPSIMALPSQVSSLFKNIISNALIYRHSDLSPVITITAGLEEVATPGGAKEYMVLRFSDNGMGFDERYKNKIFQMFQRLNSGSAFSGTGMGLAICKKIMENHGGFITAEGELGKGATFYCYFPAGDES